MILNQKQQKNLFKLLDGNHSTSGQPQVVELKVKGQDLVGCLRNYEGRRAKI